MPQRRSYQRVVDHYVPRIVDGQFAAGDALPTELGFAEEFGLSRGVAREAIRALEERGLVTVVHGRGQRVAEAREWRVFDPTVLAALLTGPDAGAFLEEMLECRLIAEPSAAALAAERADDAALAEVRASFERLPSTLPGPRPTDREAALAAERAFHEAVLWASGNRPLARMLAPVYVAFEQASELIPPRKAAYRERRAIHDAIVARDPAGAREAVEKHLRAVRRGLR